MPPQSRAVGWPLLAFAAAVAVGAAVGALVGLVWRAASEPSEAWADLGAIVLGMLAAAAVGAVAWAVGLVLVARRLFPAGRRLAPVAWSAAAVAATAAVLAAVGRAVTDAGVPGDTWSVTAVVVPLVPSLVFWLWWRRLRADRAVRQSPSIHPSGPGSSTAAAGPQEPGA